MFAPVPLEATPRCASANMRAARSTSAAGTPERSST